MGTETRRGCWRRAWVVSWSCAPCMTSRAHPARPSHSAQSAAAAATSYPSPQVAQRECGRREDVGGPARIALPGEDVEDDVGGVDALGDRLGASGPDCRQPVGEHRGEDVDHLPIAVVDTGAPAPPAL